MSMTLQGANNEIDLSNSDSMTNEGYQPHQRLSTSSNPPDMLAHGYLNPHDHSVFPSYDVGFNDCPGHYEPVQSTFSAEIQSSPFVCSLPSKRDFYPETFPMAFSLSQNCLSRPLFRSTQETEPARIFDHEGFLQYSPVHMTTTTNPSLHTTLYSQPLLSNSMAQPLPFTRAYEPTYTSPFWPEPSTPVQTPWLGPKATCYSEEPCDDAEDEVYDRPYAQLIYQALMDAPGHRMLLRDIYEWFQKNTRKPHESGTNGWQNSIRHNLSMNQAFENDKNDPAAKGGARKANSVWVLTEHAIRHGVQSTTRYRKNATSRRSSSKRTPALQRQRSGARGGRATRRAARVKVTRETQQLPSTTERHQVEGSSLPGYSWSSQLNTQDQYSACGYSPITPSGDQMLNYPYSLHYRPHYEYGQHMLPKVEAEEQIFVEEDEELRQMLCQSSANDLF